MPSYLFCHPATHILVKGGRRERLKEVHSSLESAMSSYCYHRAVSKTVVSSSSSSVVVIIIIIIVVDVVVVLVLSVRTTIDVYVCAFQRSLFFFILVRSYARLAYNVFISIFNISPFFFLFSSFARTLFPGLVLHAFAGCNQSRRTTIATNDNSFRIPLPASLSVSLSSSFSLSDAASNLPVYMCRRKRAKRQPIQRV